jgi:hypothetical protein
MCLDNCPFTPVVGDIKGLAEAVQNPTAVKVIAAGVGLVPGAGDLAGKGSKAADRARDIQKAAGAARQGRTTTAVVETAGGGFVLLTRPWYGRATPSCCHKERNLLENSNANNGGHPFLKFRLEADDDGWSPVGVECIPAIEHEGGVYEVMVPPLFLKDIAVGDQITVNLDDENCVTAWTHKSRFSRSTILAVEGRRVRSSAPLRRPWRCPVPRVPRSSAQ